MHASTPEPEAGAQCGNPARWDLCGGPPVRAVPTANFIFADLVFVEPDLVLAGAEAFLDWPAGAGHGDQITESCVFGVVAVVVGELAVVDGFADHVLVVGVGRWQQRPVVDPVTLCPDATGSALPGGVVEFGCEVVELDLFAG